MSFAHLRHYELKEMAITDVHLDFIAILTDESIEKQSKFSFFQGIASVWSEMCVKNPLAVSNCHDDFPSKSFKRG